MTKIKQERTNQDRTKIDPLFDFILHFSIFLLKVFSIASRLSSETMFKIASKIWEKNEERTNHGPYLAR